MIILYLILLFAIVYSMEALLTKHLGFDKFLASKINDHVKAARLVDYFKSTVLREFMSRRKDYIYRITGYYSRSTNGFMALDRFSYFHQFDFSNRLWVTYFSESSKFYGKDYICVYSGNPHFDYTKRTNLVDVAPEKSEENCIIC
jgi:hypothetical protein